MMTSQNTKKIIAFQGTAGANSNLACEKFYPEFQVKSYQTFSDVFLAVKKGEVNYGMIPLENSYAGRVSEIHNLLQDSKITIIAEHFFAIEHYLAAPLESRIEDITEIFSHPQALMQCQNNLRKLNLQNTKLTEFSNTAQAAEFVAQTNDKSKAVLCSKKAAQINNLKILAENLQDLGPDNFTLFVLISKEFAEIDPKIAPVITTLLFTVKNITGALYKSLGGFATNNVNMIKLESYIPSTTSSQAKFFISIEGHPSEKPVASALSELEFFSQNVKLLGTYYADKARGL